MSYVRNFYYVSFNHQLFYLSKILVACEWTLMGSSSFSSCSCDASGLSLGQMVELCDGPSSLPHCTLAFLLRALW